MLVAASDSGQVGMWELDGGTRVAGFNLRKGKRTVHLSSASSRDGRLLVAIAGHRPPITVVDGDAKKVLRRIGDFTGSNFLTALAFARTSENLLVVLTATTRGRVEVWSADSGVRLRTLHTIFIVREIQLDPAVAGYVLLSGDGGVSLFNLDSLMQSLKNHGRIEEHAQRRI